MESKALGFNVAYVDIFSASWGPPDNGKAMDGPKGITAMVLEQAMAKVSNTIIRCCDQSELLS